MSSVHILSVADGRSGAHTNDLLPARLLRASAERAASSGGHTRTDDPSAADLIVFAENHENTAASGLFLEHLRAHPVYRAHRAKCFVVSGLDRPVPTLPGIYASIPRRLHRPWWTASGPYLAEVNPALAGMAPVPAHRPRMHLASFVGATRNKPVRAALMARLAREQGFAMIDGGAEFVAALRAGDAARVLELKHRYVHVSADSSFVLCPRGSGPSSIRLFEVMQLGVCPVIIADDWVEPPGVDWASCSLRVQEAHIDRLPELLRERQADAAMLGQAARAQWERCFAPAALFGWVVDTCLSIRQHPSHAPSRGRLLALREQLRPEHLRTRLRSLRARSSGS